METFYSITRIWLALIYLASAATAQQKPFIDGDPAGVDTSQWNFNFSSSAPHYFASAYGLLQQWSNTFFPNGHSIAPCEIPPLTKLYHGRKDAEVPPSPEWVAFDIGMAYGIMGGDRNSHMLTYQTTRRAKCIYFDGESATLFGSGQLDTQMLHIWGNLSGPGRPDNGWRGLWEEYARAIGLCDWLQDKGLGSPGFGFEGIVRMNAGFEMIWCNFSSPSIRLVSHLNVTAPLLPAQDEDEIASKEDDYEPTSYFPLPPSPTRSDKATDPSNPPQPPVMGREQWAREPFFPTQAWNWGASALAHYGSSANGPGLGEARVKITSCGFLSYYAPEFLSEALPRAVDEQKSLNLSTDGLWTGPGSDGIREGALEALKRRRRLHTLEHVTTADAAIMRSHSERVLKDLLSPAPANCSGIDWSTITNDIVQNYASSLLTFLKALRQYPHPSNRTEVKIWMTDIRDQTHTFLVSFLQYPDMDPPDEDIWTRESPLFKDTYSLCRFQYTRLLDPKEGVVLGPEEELMKWAVEETLGGICFVLVDIGLSTEGIWEANFNISPSKKTRSAKIPGLNKEVKRWIEGVEELMSWLGWAGEWIGCDVHCEWDEKCYIPMWPIIPSGRRRPGRGRHPGGPGYGGPGYGRPPIGPPNGTFPGSPGNGTWRGPGRGFNPWTPSEAGLWKPKCVKKNYILEGDPDED
ncbi:hypothetical protein N431DRAFT_83506 [Stipitochalara longipes BDJ]|nr:hypothetical protein N431DRAFT_83506 [Stipitochalara longipes BDJ]